MKKLIALSPLLLVLAGCATLPPGSIDTTAVILRGAARDGAVVAMQQDPGTKKYFQLASAVLSTFVTGKDYSPGAFQSALLAVDGPELQNPWVQIGMGTVIDLYQLYYGQYVQGKINGVADAKILLVAVQDGLNAALGQPVPVGAVLAVPPHAVLPRPIKR